MKDKDNHSLQMGALVLQITRHSLIITALSQTFP